MAAVNTRRSELEQLFSSFGINADTVKELQDQIFETVSDLVDFDPSDFKWVFKTMERCPAAKTKEIWVGPKQREKISILHAWVHNRVMLGAPYEATDHTEDEARLTRDRKQMLKEKATSLDSQNLKSPTKFKSFTKWVEFRDSLMHYLSRITGVSTCPLSYVLRTQEDPHNKWKDPTNYITSNAYYGDCIKLSGSYYETDNSRVWSELKTAVEGTVGWQFIKVFEKKEDGRAAYFKLMDQGMSTNSRQALILKALDVVANTTWSGPKQNFCFDDYVGKYVTAYNDLELLEYPQGDIQKVHMFLKNIQDPRAQSSKVTIFGQPKIYSENFVEVCAFMTNSLTKQSLHRLERGASGARVSSAYTGANTNNHPVYKGTIENKKYPLAVYKTFSKAQREKLRNLRLSDSSNSVTGKRKLASVSTPVSDSEDNPDQQKTGTGGEFGSAGRKKRRQD